MAGRVDDVDLDAVIAHAGGLGQNGDAALALQFVGIHHALDIVLVFAEDAALIQHGVHQRGLAVIDVRNDGDIAREAIMLLRFAMIGRGTQDFRLHSDTTMVARPDTLTETTLPVVVIVGRPNVGKSTLFNAILGQRRSIVGDEPGITRDRIHGRRVLSGTAASS